ncbi:hypothetical protein GLW08_21320 [Pontibacillus yanchengensis]|uniref:Uncharacterized protein n=2 Tax=Pontibacillus yanchengensis TaxID=462910 RepID=A0ACC7VMN8_9BACI|nr:hypothetical protein [Pontibacillus yanchengensis]MYL35425.1 hypothetical protein [Pontibacillus yanchengensis]MYL55844.1 hypothetical protein [Pontibacillus yanchengensis]
MEKLVNMDFDTTQVKVEITEGMSEEDILKKAQETFAQRILEGKSGRCKYNIAEADGMSLQESKVGQVVSVKDEKGYGVIIEVKPNRKFPLSVALPKGVVQVKPFIVKKETTTNVDKVIESLGRKEFEKEIGWFDGHAGFLFNGKDVVPVIFGKGTKAYYYVHPVSLDAEGRVYKLKQPQLTQVFDDKQEAEKRIG